MAIKPLPLNSFLSTSNLSGTVELPWAHSTAASNLMDIIASGRLLATPCNVFKGEKLCYLFIGRPAYKMKPVENPSSWQLPVAFVVRFAEKPSIKRIYPFDSGAFHGRRLPSYITTFRLGGYELDANPELAGRLISFFFKSTDRYFMRRPAGLEELKEDHNLDMRHAEILALSRLYHETSAPKFDDRAAAIEVQIDEDIQLTPQNLLGVVMPSEYARVDGFVDDVKRLTSIVETYDLFPLGTAAHFGLLYEGVQRVYKRAGVTP
jgi:hypothetical protein